MKTSKYFTDNVIFCLTICVLLSFLFQIFGLNTAVNLIYTISLLLVFICYIGSGYYSKITFLITIFIGLSSVIHGFRYNVLDYYIHILISLCTYICMDVSAYVKLRTDTFKRISKMFLVVSIILLVAYYLGPLKTSYFKHTDSIDLNMHNPNAAGMWLVCIFILLVYYFHLFKDKIRFLYLLAAIGVLPILFATQSRNSFLAALLFVLGIIVAKFFTIKKVPNIVLLIIAILPLIVFVVYMFVINENMDFWSEFFSFSGSNKSLESRVTIWNKVISDFWNCFLLGDYYNYYDLQMHNSLLTIFCRFGAPVTLLTCVSIYRSLKRLQKNSSFNAVLSLGAVYFTGCFEASIFVGVAGLYLMVLIIPACSSVENNESRRNV